MKRPRDISGQELAVLLRVFGYMVTRQVGSHMRLTTQECGEHHLTVPSHRNLTVGKINDVVWRLVNHFRKPRHEIMETLFK